MKLVIFGTGKFYQNRKNYFTDNGDEIIAYIDNRFKHSSEFEGCNAYPPSMLKKLKFDKVVLMSISQEEMLAQLRALGIHEKKIWTFYTYQSIHQYGSVQLHIGCEKKARKNILLITHSLSYYGACIAIVYAAKALSTRGYYAQIAAPNGSAKMINEINSYGIDVAICPGLPYIGKEELLWIQRFDAVVLNMFPVIECACDIGKIMPALWWIHEPIDDYLEMFKKYPEYKDISSFFHLKIIGVADIAKKNFNKFYPEKIKELMPYGIPDKMECCDKRDNKKRMIFAIIGSVIYRKAQDVFLSAVEQLDEDTNCLAEFWIIGNISQDEYGNKIKSMADNMRNVKIWGNLSREEITKTYQDIDVVVCPSREDPLPIVMTEGMMYGKVCIASDATGTVEFIEHGVNGYICPKDSSKDLAEEMSWIIYHKEACKAIGEKARKTYEDYFSMERFGERLEQQIIKLGKIPDKI